MRILPCFFIGRYSSIIEDSFWLFFFVSILFVSGKLLSIVNGSFDIFDDADGD